MRATGALPFNYTLLFVPGVGESDWGTATKAYTLIRSRSGRERLGHGLFLVTHCIHLIWCVPGLTHSVRVWLPTCGAWTSPGGGERLGNCHLLYAYIILLVPGMGDTDQRIPPMCTLPFVPGLGESNWGTATNVYALNRSGNG